MNNYNIDFMNKEDLLQKINEAAEFINSKINKKPEIALVLGSGLGKMAEKISNPIIIKFEEIPNFPKSTVEGHGGKIFIGEYEGKYVLAMQGRYHYYEGYDTQTLTLPIRVFNVMGIKKLILTNACGGVNKHFEAGDLMIIEDHIGNFCPSPLRGAHLEKFGPRFTDMAVPYDKEYIEIAEKSAKKLNIKIQKGVYAYWHGPSYETPAELRAYVALGADVVGMSTVPENIIAVNCGMRVLGISCVTNMTNIIKKGPTTHEDVMEMGLKVSDNFISLLTDVLKEM